MKQLWNVANHADVINKAGGWFEWTYKKTDDREDNDAK